MMTGWKVDRLGSLLSVFIMISGTFKIVFPVLSCPVSDLFGAQSVWIVGKYFGACIRVLAVSMSRVR